MTIAPVPAGVPRGQFTEDNNDTGKILSIPGQRFQSVNEFREALSVIENLTQLVQEVTITTQVAQGTLAGSSPQKSGRVRPRGITIISVYCIMTGLLLTIYILGFLGTFGGFLMLKGKDIGKKICLVYLVITICVSAFISVVVSFEQSELIYLILFMIIGLIVIGLSTYFFIYLVRPNVKQYFQPIQFP